MRNFVMRMATVLAVTAAVSACASTSSTTSSSTPSASIAAPSPTPSGDNVAACVAARNDTNHFSPLLDKATTVSERKTIIADWVAALRADAALGTPATGGIADLAVVVAAWPTTKGTPGIEKLTAYANGLNDVCQPWIAK